MSLGPSRATVMSICAVYIASFHLAYAVFLEPAFGYFGFRMDQESLPLLGGAIALAWLPSLWLPYRTRKATELTYWMLYLTVFVPSMLVPTYVGRLEAAQLLPLIGVLAAGFAVLRCFHFLKPLKIARRAMSPALFRTALLVPASILFVYLAVKFHSQFRLVSFGDVYDQRAASSDAMSAADRYISLWLATGFNPFFITYGLFRRRPAWTWLGIGGQVLVYALTALKNVLLMPMIYIVVYWIVSRRKSPGVAVTLGAACLLGATLVIHAASGSAWSLLLSAIVVMRTFGVPGLCTQQYFEFFSAHPLTYFSQVTGVNLFVHYPYTRSIYYEIGDAFYGNPLLSANAHFWAMDGLASLGLPGILGMSLLCGIVFWAFDSLGELAGSSFMSVLLISVGIQITNGSLFTTLTSGGGILLAFYVFFMPDEGRASSAPAPLYGGKL